MATNEEPELIAVPTSQLGDFNAPSSTARTLTPSSTIEAMEEPSSQVINYYFPIEVEVIGGLDESQMQLVANYIYDELITALQS